MIVPPRESPTFVHGPGVDLVYDSNTDPGLGTLHQVTVPAAPAWGGPGVTFNLLAYREWFVYIMNEGAAGCTNVLRRIRLRWGIGGLPPGAYFTIFNVNIPLTPATVGRFYALHRMGIGWPLDLPEPWAAIDLQSDGGFPLGTCQLYIMGRK